MMHRVAKVAFKLAMTLAPKVILAGEALSAGATVESKPAEGSDRPRQPARIMFALDATGSREPQWARAQGAHAALFNAVKTLGAIEAQLVHFGGTQFSQGRWTSDPDELASEMRAVTCETGVTQIRRVLKAARKAAKQRQGLAALIYVGDQVEDFDRYLEADALRLGAMGVRGFFLQDDNCRCASCRAGFVPSGRLLQTYARAMNGAFHRLSGASGNALAEVLRAASIFAVGGHQALGRAAAEPASSVLREVAYQLIQSESSRSETP